jgi:hypothetical protein
MYSENFFIVTRSTSIKHSLRYLKGKNKSPMYVDKIKNRILYHKIAPNEERPSLKLSFGV